MIDATPQDQNAHLALVVDDSPQIRTYIRTVLRSAGVQVLEAADGLEALELFRAGPERIDFVVSDIRMPRMTGTALGASLREVSPEIPLIFVSGEAAPWGPNDPQNRSLFLEKPFTPAMLLDAARRFCDRIPMAC